MREGRGRMGMGGEVREGRGRVGMGGGERGEGGGGERGEEGQLGGGDIING